MPRLSRVVLLPLLLGLYNLFGLGNLDAHYGLVLSDVLVNSYRLETDSAATETLSLSYDKFEQYILTPGGEQKACWNVSAGTC